MYVVCLHLVAQGGVSACPETCPDPIPSMDKVFYLTFDDQGRWSAIDTANLVTMLIHPTRIAAFGLLLSLDRMICGKSASVKSIASKLHDFHAKYSLHGLKHHAYLEVKLYAPETFDIKKIDLSQVDLY